MDLFKRKRLRRSTLKESTNWEDVGRMQFEFLLREGLQPHHHLLDIGCGSFRGGRFVIDYLQEGHYFGIDREAQHLEAGMKHVLAHRVV